MTLDARIRELIERRAADAERCRGEQRDRAGDSPQMSWYHTGLADAYELDVEALRAILDDEAKS